MPSHHRVAIERATSNDLTELATETATAPMQMAAVLRFEPAIAGEAITAALAERVATVPRLRQRLTRSSFGLGRPVWVDDEEFDIARHVVNRPWPKAIDRSAVLAVAAVAVVDPLPRDRPLWSATLITDTAGTCHAIVVVVHHVLADGIGGLAVLEELMDHGPIQPARRFPMPPPSTAEQLADVVRSTVRLLRSIPTAVRTLRYAASELGGGRDHAKPSRTPARCSLNRPITRLRTISVAQVNLAALHATAHSHAATINDVLLTAIGGALHTALLQRGESPETLVMSVPVSSRRQASATRLGNQVGVIPANVPVQGEPIARLAAIAGTTRAGSRTDGRGASAAILGIVFRALARIGLFQWFISHQRLVNTFVTNMRGPEDRLSFLGSTITDIIPVSPIAGNVTVAFAALSYAGTMTIAVIADPQTCSDADRIATELQNQLEYLASRSGRRSSRSTSGSPR